MSGCLVAHSVSAGAYPFIFGLLSSDGTLWMFSGGRGGGEGVLCFCNLHFLGMDGRGGGKGKEERSTRFLSRPRVAMSFPFYL